MVNKYINMDISRVWNKNKEFARWLAIELSYLKSQEEMGLIPKISDNIESKVEYNENELDKLEDETKHDVIAFVKYVSKFLTEEEARYFHKNLTSSDIKDTSFTMALAESYGIVAEKIEFFCEALRNRAMKHKDLHCISRTHGVHAEPYSFGLKFLSFLQEGHRVGMNFMEARTSLFGAAKMSGSVGTCFDSSPEIELSALIRVEGIYNRICKKFGIDTPYRAVIFHCTTSYEMATPCFSTQIVPRDIYLKYMFALLTTSNWIDRICTEIRNLQRTEIAEVQEYFGETQRGSSAMPHKRNPIHCERLCGLARVVRGNFMAISENGALWHERDMTHSSCERIIFPDTLNLVAYMLDMCKEIVEKLVVDEENIEKNLNRYPSVFSQKLMNYLLGLGHTREQAYLMVKEAVEQSKHLDIGLREFLVKHRVCGDFIKIEDLDGIFDMSSYYKNIDAIYENYGLIIEREN